MLDAREAKTVNGYELVGNSASSTGDVIENLFLDAEKEYQTRGRKSRPHVIIIDHLDAIVRRRIDKSDEGDHVVNKLLSKVR